MARSVGEAAATGLESGINLAFRIAEQKRDQRRQDEQDAMSREDRQRVINRRGLSDAAAADAATAASDQADAQATIDSGGSLTPAQAFALQDRQNARRAAADARAASVGGASLADAAAPTQAAAQSLSSGQAPDLSQVPGTRARALLQQGTGLAWNDFRRGDDGSPSKVDQALQSFGQSMDAGNPHAAIPAMNYLLQGQINKIKGKPSPHGSGTIVGAELADLHEDPNSPPDDPRVVPMLKVYVNDPKSTGPQMENGATGYYMAPVTEGRGTGGDAKVKAISTKSGMEYFGNFARLAEQLNNPEARTKFDEPGDDLTPQGLAEIQARAGVKPRAKTRENFSLKPDEVRVDREVDAQGRPIPGTETRTEGNKRSSTRALTPLDAYRQSLAAAVDNGEMSEEEAADQMRTAIKAAGQTGGRGGAQSKPGTDKDADIQRVKDLKLPPKIEQAALLAITSGIKPGKYTGSGLSGAGGGSVGPSLKERQQDHKEAVDSHAAASRNSSEAQKALREFDLSLKDKSPDEQASAETKTERSRLKARIATMQQQEDDALKDLNTARTARDAAKNGTPSIADAKPSSPAGRAANLSKAGASIAKQHGF